ncbi:MAG: hypothetical protein PHS57_09185 [Alphaproteobacteria bacterium]|nr:hypothetical protein [Alphaproteobacteria bacterium]
MMNTAANFRPNASSLEDFWWQTNPTTSAETFQEKFEELMELKYLTAHDLARVAYVAALNEKAYQNSESAFESSYKDSVLSPRKLWQTRSAEWFNFVIQEREQMTHHDLWTMFSGLARFNAKPPQKFFDAVFKEAPPLLPKLTPYERKDFVHSLLYLRSKGPHPAFDQAFLYLLKNDLGLMTAKQLTRLPRALHNHGIRPDHSFVGSYLSVVRKHLEAEHSHLSMVDFPAQDLVWIPRLFKDAGLSPSLGAQGPFWNLYFSLARRKLPAMRNEDIPRWLHACARYGVLPNEDFFHAFWPDLEKRLKGFSPQELSTTLYALALMGKTPPQSILTSACQRILAHINDFESQATTNAFWGLAVLSVACPLPDTTRDCARALRDHAATLPLKDIEADACFHAARRLFPDESPHPFAPKPEKQILSSYRTTCLEKFFPNRTWDDKTNTTLSSLPGAPGQALNRTLLLHNMVDRAWIERTNTPVFVRFDSPWLYMRDLPLKTPRYNGKASLLNALVLQHYPKALFLRVMPEAAYTLSEEDFRNILQKTPLLKPGAYRLALDQKAGPVLRRLPPPSNPFADPEPRRPSHHSLWLIVEKARKNLFR